VFNGRLKLPITDGGLTQMWHRLARVLTPWYEQIHRHGLDAGVGQEFVEAFHTRHSSAGADARAGIIVSAAPPTGSRKHVTDSE